MATNLQGKKMRTHQDDDIRYVFFGGKRYILMVGCNARHFSKIYLARSIESMRGMKGCTNIRFLIRKELCHHLSTSL